MNKHVSITTIYLICSFLLANPSTAQSDFETHLDTTYQLETNGATVTTRLTITNKADTQFSTAYSLILPSDSISDLTVTDSNNQSIAANPIILGGLTKLNLEFKQPIVGIGKSQTYTISYTQKDSLNGTTVNSGYTIPYPLTNQETSNSLTINAPHTICAQPEAFPKSSDTKTDTLLTSFTYPKGTTNASVTILCAPARHESLILTYYLENRQLTPVETQIALPPDTSTQRLIFDSIDPAPIRLDSDADGNRIATYKLESQTSLIVTASIRGVIVPPSKPHPIRANTQHTLQSTHYWPASDQSIKKIAKELGTPDQIYQYVISKTTYNPDRFETNDAHRIGGQAIIKQPDDMQLLDFIDSFITLARAANIPARRVMGIAENANPKNMPLETAGGKLHTWAEYYDPQTNTWIPVDPAWEKSALGRHFFPIQAPTHIALVINGHSDSTPHPAGFYTPPNTKDPDIVVSPTKPFTFPTPKLTFLLSSSLINQLINTNQSKLTITNQSPFSVHNLTTALSTTTASSLPVSVTYLGINSTETLAITGTIDPNQTTIETNYGPYPITIHTAHFPTIPTLAASVVTIAGILATVTRRLLVSRRQ
jgi:hypothetical protein